MDASGNFVSAKNTHILLSGGYVRMKVAADGFCVWPEIGTVYRAGIYICIGKTCRETAGGGGYTGNGKVCLSKPMVPEILSATAAWLKSMVRFVDPLVSSETTPALLISIPWAGP